MNGLKQRIIGALVLVSLAVIFVPMMFDEPHSKRESNAIQIPEEPPFPEVEMPVPETPEPPGYRMEELDNDNAVGEPVAEPEPAQETVPAFSESAGMTEAADSAAPPEDNQPSENEPVSEDLTRSLEGAWVVQLGSFGSEDNATRLREKVRERGYSSHLQRITRGDTELTRVFSGPFAEKAEAEKAKQVLDKVFDLNSLVTSGGK